ncbi:DUF881 domain-containing protein [Nakamurella sp. A5-74]|uniref:DUF881 domain-containing protein n=1 Tax=Nakamurella sp. A5-74 TaxID=3158264 RepID=A0AAU8DJV8_9ACTN
MADHRPQEPREPREPGGPREPQEPQELPEPLELPESDAVPRQTRAPSGSSTDTSPREFGLAWLQGMANDALDPGYAAAARRRSPTTPGSGARRHAPSTAVRLAVAMLVAGLSVGIAVGWRHFTAPADAKARSAVLQDVRVAQSRQDVLAARAEELDAQIRGQQMLAGAGGPLRSVTALRDDAALTAVTGPGVQLTVDQADSTTPILDRDLQFLVNGLWEAGAEAVSVGGVRLRSTSAIRQAGGAILVDNRPVFWPITIDAIGDPEAVQVALVSTAGYGRMLSLKSNYGAGFTVATVGSLTLPGGGTAELRYADVPTSTSTSTSTSASTADRSTDVPTENEPEPTR